MLMMEEHAPYLFQRELPGPDYLVDLVGRLCISRKIFRQRGGCDVAMLFEDVPVIREITRVVAERLHTDVLNAQFRQAADGMFQLYDVGTRLSGASVCTMATDCNLVEELLMLGKFVPSKPVAEVKWGRRVDRYFEEVWKEE